MKLHTVTGTLTPAAPFDFEQTLDFLGGFGAMTGEQTLAPRSLSKTLALNGEAIVFQLVSRGTVDKPALDYTLYSANKLNAETEATALERIRFFVSLDEDLRPFYALGNKDAKFAPVIQRLYGLHQVKFLTPFENAAWAVLTQRTPMRVAHTVKLALVEKYGARLTVNGTDYVAFPEASQLFPISAGELNEVIRNERKTEYFRAVVEAFANVSDEFLYHAPTEEVKAWLLSIKGIGTWSAYFILLRGLGRNQELYFDANSQPMKAFSQAIGKVYANGNPLDAKAMTKLAEPYGEWKGYWAYYLRTNA